MANKNLLIGIDIGCEDVQIAYYDDTQFEPVSLEKVIKTDEDYDDERIIRECFTVIGEEIEGSTIAKLAIALEEYSKERSEQLKAILGSYGMNSERAVVLNYKQCYLYYVLNQSNDLWVNDVGLFEYGKNGLVYRQLAVDRRRNPYIVGILEKNFTDMIEEEDVENRRYLLENIAESAIHKQIISTIYVTGKGFEGDWANDTLKKLCRGRRVFKGSNLYVRGACYAARKLAGLSRMPEYIYIDDDMIPVHVSTCVYVNATEQELIITKAGTPWQETEASIYVIPDNENELQINITNVLTRAKSSHFIPLDFLGEERLDMKTRLRVRVRFQDVNRCIITLSDEGFGEICRSSRKMYERVIDTSVF